jgi:Icc protein
VKPLVFAHVSDLHVSAFGDTFHDRKHQVRRSVRVADTEAVRWETYWEEAGWRVLHARGARRGKLQIVDPEGYAHPLPGRKDHTGLSDPVERAAAQACRLEARRAVTLAQGSPSRGALEIMHAATPSNSNLRLLRAAAELPADIDGVLITGDLTDNGDGYEVVLSAFERFQRHKMLFSVPGNHDKYLFPLRGSTRPPPTHESKAMAFGAFAAACDLALEPCGAWARSLPEHDVMLIGLDSCARKQRAFYRHNGAVGPEQLAFLRDLSATPSFKAARHRIVMLHHHVVPLPQGVGRKAPSEIGMRLDDSRAAAEAFDAAGITLVLHGHRHVSEQRQPAGANFTILAAPSFTLGCKSGDGPSYWRIELGARMHIKRVRLGDGAVLHDDGEPEAGTEDAEGL